MSDSLTALRTVDPARRMDFQGLEATPVFDELLEAIVSGQFFRSGSAKFWAQVAGGLTDREVGEQLSIRTSTVRSHLDRIGEKTGLRRRAELTRLAVDLGIVD